MSEEEQKYFKGLIGFTFDSDDIRYIEKIVDKKDKEIERLNNIINELEKYSENMIVNYNEEIKKSVDNIYIDRFNLLGARSSYREISNKIKELKENK